MLEEKIKAKAEAFELLAEMRIEIENAKEYLEMKYGESHDLIEQTLEKRFETLRRCRNKVMISIQKSEPFLLN